MLAIIPARGGSKGLPNKNIKNLNGLPLIAHTILAAKKSSKISKIIVSTDSQEILDISNKYGADTNFLRPKELATDDSKVIDTYIHILNKLTSFGEKNIDSFVVLQPTSPLRLSADIDAAIELFYNKNADSVLAYTEEHHPIFWHKYLKEDGSLEPIFEETLENRQKLKKSYFPNGSIYVFKSEIIFQNKYTTEKSFAYIMPRSRSIDIDTIDDFELAEYLMRKNETRTSV